MSFRGTSSSEIAELVDVTIFLTIIITYPFAKNFIYILTSMRAPLYRHNVLDGRKIEQCE